MTALKAVTMKARPVKTALSAAFIGGLAMSASAQPNTDFAVTGQAYSLQSPDHHLYNEAYTAPDEQQRVRVVYTQPGGEPLADKTLDISTGKLTPSYRLIDHRSGDEVSMRVEDKRLTLQVDEQGERRTEVIDRREPQVVDAGFAALVRTHWQALGEGEEVVFYFALPAKARNIKLAMREVSSQNTPFASTKPDWRYFEMRPASALIRLFASSVYLAFNPDRQLMRYAGRSNLSGANGEPQDVLIRYRYHRSASGL